MTSAAGARSLHRWSLPRRRGSTLGCAGPGCGRVVAFGLIGLLVWAMVGSLLLGLQTPETSDAKVAGLWFAGIGAIVGIAVLAVLNAARVGPGRDEDRR